MDSGATGKPLGIRGTCNLYTLLGMVCNGLATTARPCLFELHRSVLTQSGCVYQLHVPVVLGFVVGPSPPCRHASQIHFGVLNRYLSFKYSCSHFLPAGIAHIMLIVGWLLSFIICLYHNFHLFCNCLLPADIAPSFNCGVAFQVFTVFAHSITWLWKTKGVQLSTPNLAPPNSEPQPTTN